ncbi:hypothetical protein CDL60_12200 [Roseateles noduli]|nr:hypothetical protein CDL60_12200 [Roseateles noduli]
MPSQREIPPLPEETLPLAEQTPPPDLAGGNAVAGEASANMKSWNDRGGSIQFRPAHQGNWKMASSLGDGANEYRVLTQTGRGEQASREGFLRAKALSVSARAPVDFRDDKPQMKSLKAPAKQERDGASTAAAEPADDQTAGSDSVSSR